MKHAMNSNIEAFVLAMKALGVLCVMYQVYKFPILIILLLIMVMP